MKTLSLAVACVISSAAFACEDVEEETSRASHLKTHHGLQVEVTERVVGQTVTQTFRVQMPDGQRLSFERKFVAP
jgi:hypothetical protein